MSEHDKGGRQPSCIAVLAFAAPSLQSLLNQFPNIMTSNFSDLVFPKLDIHRANELCLVLKTR